MVTLQPFSSYGVYAMYDRRILYQYNSEVPIYTTFPDSYNYKIRLSINAGNSNDTLRIYTTFPEYTTGAISIIEFTFWQKSKYRIF